MCGFSMQTSGFWIGITILYVSQTSPVVLCMHYSVISTRKTCLYEFQPSSVALCMQNGDVRTRLTSLYRSQTSSVVFSTHNNEISTKKIINICSSPHLWFCACKTATIGLELQVSFGPRLHLWFLHAKQWLLDQNDKSLWVQDMTCRFVQVQQRA